MSAVVNIIPTPIPINLPLRTKKYDRRAWFPFKWAFCPKRRQRGLPAVHLRKLPGNNYSVDVFIYWCWVWYCMCLRACVGLNLGDAAHVTQNSSPKELTFIYCQNKTMRPHGFIYFAIFKRLYSFTLIDFNEKCDKTRIYFGASYILTCSSRTAAIRNSRAMCAFWDGYPRIWHNHNF